MAVLIPLLLLMLLLYSCADVSTAAAGGQVLVDESTFLAVKEDLWRLGLVTAAGLDYDLLYNAAAGSSRSGSSRTRSGGRPLLPCLRGNR